jgi:hypothetical protein
MHGEQGRTAAASKIVLGSPKITSTSGRQGNDRNIERGLAADFACEPGGCPALTAAAAPVAAQTPSAKTAAEQAQAALKDATATKLVLLGTGGGAGGLGPRRTRKMTSHAMLSEGGAYVLDCGVGVIDQYASTGIPFRALRSIFITHHHADHNIECGPLLVEG